jgi:hypothetical protein
VYRAMEKIFQDLWRSVTQPGHINQTILTILHGAFISLFSLLIIILYYVWDWHLLALLSLSVCLYALILWTLRQIPKD